MSGQQFIDLSGRALIDRLSELHRQCHGTWVSIQEPHAYRDGTTHFTHVEQVSSEHANNPLRVLIGRYLTDELAELMVMSRNNLPELLRLARIGLDHETDTAE